MAAILSYIVGIPLGERINEDEIISNLNKSGKNATKYQLFNELEKLKKKGIVSVVVNENDSKKRVYAIKTGEIEPLKLVNNNIILL